MSNAVATLPRAGTSLVTAEQVTTVLSYCKETGQFTWKQNRGGGAKAGDSAGTLTTTGYIQIHCMGRLYFAHRLAWLVTYGAWPAGMIDHLDGDGTNNRLSNLRDVSAAVNQQNQRRAHRSNKSSGLLGAHFDARTGRWLAKISAANRTVNLGRYDTAVEAHAAYIKAKRTMHIGATI